MDGKTITDIKLMKCRTTPALSDIDAFDNRFSTQKANMIKTFTKTTRLHDGQLYGSLKKYEMSITGSIRIPYFMIFSRATLAFESASRTTQRFSRPL